MYRSDWSEYARWQRRTTAPQGQASAHEDGDAGNHVHSGRMIKHAGRWVLGLGANDSAHTVFERLNKQLTPQRQNRHGLALRRAARQRTLSAKITSPHVRARSGTPTN